MPFYAHSGKEPSKQDWHSLEEHLTSAADLAMGFAAPFQAGAFARLASLWHDLGKFQPAFQKYIEGKGPRVEHAIVGALLVMEKVPKELEKWSLAFVIAGHHTGLANLASGEGGPKPLQPRLKEAAKKDFLRNARPHLSKDLLDSSIPELPTRFRATKGMRRTEREDLRCSLEFWIRFLFSALIDADRLDTEDFYQPGSRKRLTQGFKSIQQLMERVDKYVDALTLGAAPTPVNALRANVLNACRRMSECPPGLFSLSVPTGGGKTLAAMSFALRHAQRHGLRRVIVAIPYTSIIEQNAAVYRQALGDQQVIEHHSNLDPEKETTRNKLTTENWDAPVIVTTNVQFFESLFANRTSRCRKVHNIAGSVILLDEVQTLPSGFLIPILDALRELRDNYGCSIVLSTATQPALHRRPALPQGLEGVTSIWSPDADRTQPLKRFRVTWPKAAKTEWPELAAELETHPKVLAIVHRRQDARDLAALLPEEGRYHLSALMCPAHRSERLDEIKDALKTGLCRVVSTQLVEAGVDVDFPRVYRAMAGLDSLIQAGGRCNREGSLELGELVVFRALTSPPPGTPTLGLETMEALLQKHGGEALDFGDPRLIEDYFKMLFQKSGLDVNGIQAERRQFNFATVGTRFRLIEDDYQRPVVVPWGDGPRRLELFRRDPGRVTLRGLQPYVVNVPVRQLDRLRQDLAVEVIDDTVFALATGYEHLYDDHYGLLSEEEILGDPAALVV